MALAVITLGFYLFSQNLNVLDSRLFYTPEEALRYFQSLDLQLREKIVKFSMIDAVLFVPIYGITLWTLTKRFQLGLFGSRLLTTLIAADTLENILILVAITNVTPPGWPLLTLLSLTTPLKWGALIAWTGCFLIKNLLQITTQKK